jgi:hypothetical protein
VIRSLIGEHIDYALFGVLPAAIESDLIIAIASNETPAVTIDNVESKYTKASFKAEPNAGVWDLPIDADLHWSGYVKAGYLVRAHKPPKGGHRAVRSGCPGKPLCPEWRGDAQWLRCFDIEFDSIRGWSELVCCFDRRFDVGSTHRKRQTWVSHKR